LDRTKARQLIEPLLACWTAPYREDAVADYITSTLRDMGRSFTIDQYGNIVARKPGRNSSSPRIGFMAHMDHPGFEVTGHSEHGVTTAFRGGVSKEYFEKARVRFIDDDGTEYRGTCLPAETNPKNGRVENVDIVCDEKPPVGAIGMWDVEPVEFTNGLIRSRAIDDLAGCGLMLCLLHELAEREGDDDDVAEVWAVFTRAEEVGFVGAVGLALSHKLPTTVPIVSVEMSKGRPGGTQGMGPVIRLGDRSSVFDNTFLLFMKDVAAELKKESEGFKYQQMLMDGGACEATALNAFGFRTAGLAVPLSNYHNMKTANPNGPWDIEAEEISFADFTAAVDLCVAMCERFQGLQSVADKHRRALSETTTERLAYLEASHRTSGRTPS
jgi:putative aminopeptidase FrvX